MLVLTLRAVKITEKESDLREDIIHLHIDGRQRVRGTESIGPSQSGKKTSSKEVKKEQSEKWEETKEKNMPSPNQEKRKF